MTVNQHFRDERYISLFLGYPRVDVTRKLPEIRRAAVDDPYCWSHKFSDREMLGYIEHFKKLSTEIQRNCKQYDLSFVDTSENWPEALQAAYDTKLHSNVSLSLSLTSAPSVPGVVR